nr:MAG TPA: hypothetical protein [Inoviridae sp.]
MTIPFIWDIIKPVKSDTFTTYLILNFTITSYFLQYILF